MPEFKKGDRVVHPVFGPGKVLEVMLPSEDGKDDNPKATVLFDNDVRQTYDLKYAPLKLLPALAETANLAAADKWRKLQQETFIKEQPDTTHYMGSHWNPFSEDSAEFFRRLPEIINKSQLRNGFADNAINAAPYLAQAELPKTFYLSWPGQELGLLIEIESKDDKNQLVGLIPYAGLGHGIEHTVTLESVDVWESGQEAQLEVTLGESQISFFDTLFARNRGWYVAGKPYNFALSGIAYDCRVAKDKTIAVPLNSELAKALKDIPDLAETADAGTMEVHTQGMAMLMRVANWDKDDYEFHGPVKAVKAAEMLGQSCWFIRTTVMRDGDKDIDLNILVTHKVWGKETPPAVGEDIGGHLWLQGELCGADRKGIVL